jgi:hypothetical protein
MSVLCCAAISLRLLLRQLPGPATLQAALLGDDPQRILGASQRRGRNAIGFGGFFDILFRDGTSAERLAQESQSSIAGPW